MKPGLLNDFRGPTQLKSPSEPIDKLIGRWQLVEQIFEISSPYLVPHRALLTYLHERHPKPRNRRASHESCTRSLATMRHPSPPSSVQNPSSSKSLIWGWGRRDGRWYECSDIALPPEGTRREWRSFTNGARKDGLQLGHWVKANEEQPSGYLHPSLAPAQCLRN